jgi:ribosome-associated toxin RatA of RatAB toxin-antitoxin module
MGVIEGTATSEIAAPLERCFDLAADIDRITEWQKGVEHVEVTRRDDQGRAVEAKISTDAKVRTITTTVEFSYEERPHRFSWRQKKGDLKSLDGEWLFEERDGVTHATYHLVGDPGRVLGMLVRGPVEDRVREFLIGERPEELKQRAEAG